VDDNATTRGALERLLTSWGMTCDTATDGEAALGMLDAAARSAHPFGLAVIDARMPAMSGPDLARAIGDRPALHSVHLIMLTSSGGDREAGRLAGIDTFVTKPVRRSRLLHEIVRLVDEPHQWHVLDDRPPAAAPAQPGRGRMLVVDDNEVNQLVAARLLERRGFTVDLAANGREALDRHQRAHYEAIFMDCQMPGLDGYAATAEIRRREGDGRHTTIVAMTASTMKGDRERCLAAGMDHYIGKPIKPEALDEVIGRALPAGGAEQPQTEALTR
jgi:CheY-like chemotaxis protein